MHRARSLTTLAALLAFAAAARAGSVSRVEGTALGPAVESVTAITEDRRGFLWIGSRENLALYDGYTSMVFEHDVADPASISDNSIRTIYEDSKGTIWVGTNTGGLERLDRETWSFRHHRHDSRDPRSLPHDSVYAVAEDRDGNYWVGTQGGLASLDPASGKFERAPSEPAGPGSEHVMALRVDRDGALWVGTLGKGLSRRDPRSGEFRNFRHDPRDSTSLCDDLVHSIAEGTDGRLWLATSTGVCSMDREHGRFRAVPFMEAEKRSSFLASAVVVDRDGHVWAAALDAGLWRLDGSGGVEAFRRHPFVTARASDSRARIVAMTAASSGDLWLATWNEGLGRVSPRSRAAVEVPQIGSANEVASLVPEGLGRLWVGWLDRKVERLAPDQPTRGLDAGGTPLAMIRSEGDLWVGTTNGLLRVDAQRSVVREVFFRKNEPDDFGPGWIWAVARDRRGRLWLGTGGGGLFVRDDDGGFRQFRHDPDDPYSLSDDYVIALAEGPDGRMWVGTRSRGLNAWDPRSGRFTRYLPDAGDPRSLSHHSVSALLVDRAGNLWVATTGGGVNLARGGASGQFPGFERFTERDGLSSNNAVSMVEDTDGSVWVGTRGGLTRLDPDSRRVVHYGPMDGLASAKFVLAAAAESDGVLYFGTSRGVVALRGGTPFPEPRSSPLVITAVRTFGGLEATERPVPADGEVTIPWGRVLSLEFAALDYGERRRHRYGYRLSGKNDTWVDLGTRREITFTDLDPGRYELALRGRNDQGVWSELDRPLRIEVVPPFWMTTWFRVLVAGTVLGLAFGGHRLRLSSLARRNRELEELKDQRGRALVDARESQAAMNAAYGRLRRLTRRLEAAKEDERRHLARELHDEMGQALTTAKLNLQLLDSTPGSRDREQRIADTLALLDAMIGQVRALSLDLRPPLLDELGLAAALRGYVEALGKRSGVAIDLRMDEVPREIPNEVEIAVFRVVQESLTNVLRHAGTATAAVELKYDSSGIDLEVADRGKGFEVGRALERASTGRHIGLLGMKERVESMGGAMTIESAPGRGTRIRARIPLAT